MDFLYTNTFTAKLSFVDPQCGKAIEACCDGPRKQLALAMCAQMALNQLKSYNVDYTCSTHNLYNLKHCICSIVVSNDLEVLLNSLKTVREKLLNLHPQNGIYRLQSDTCLDAGFQVNSLIVDCSLVRAAIFSFPSTSASGCLGLRPEHLQDLLTSDLSGSFLQRITSLVNTLLGGGGHESVARYLCGANLIALVKEPDGDKIYHIRERYNCDGECRSVVYLDRYGKGNWVNKSTFE
ncbi:hypothetical protein GJ496_008797 [Pomphorhynchus laevis]|nr:hypothetical protein GJ496_008797 [Pomphorhynchus laevis]